MAPFAIQHIHTYPLCLHMTTTITTNRLYFLNITRLIVAIAALTFSVETRAAPPDTKERRPELGSNIPKLVNPFAISNEMWYSLFIANTPTGQRLSVDQLAPLVLSYKWPNQKIETRTRWHLNVGVYLMNVRGDGTVASVDTLQSIGHPTANSACVKAFMQWRFRPGSVKEVRVPAYLGWRYQSSVD